MAQQTEIAAMNPRTEEITASNAESRLLRLPQEIKDQIYALVLGERLLHVRYDVKAKSLSLRPCQARISEREAQDVFASSKEPWSAVELMDRNGPCYDEPHFGLDLALLTCCRQIYQDAHSLIYSTNTLSYSFPLEEPGAWVGWVPDKVLSLTRVEAFLHRLHLNIIVIDDFDAERWNESFRYIAGKLRCLRYFHVDIEQRPFRTFDLLGWNFQNPADCTFLKDLPALRVLKLRTVAITVADGRINHTVKIKLWTEEEKHYRWTMAQKQEWAAYMTRVLLGQEEREYAAVERV